MRTADILDIFTPSTLRDVVARLDFNFPKRTPCSDIVTFVAKSLGVRCGWSGAIEVVVSCLRKDELFEVVDREWLGHDGRDFVTNGKLRQLSVADLCDLARDLALADEPESGSVLADVAEHPRWAGVFNVDDEGEDEAALSVDAIAPASMQPWQQSTVITLVAGGPLPEGIEVQASRRELQHQTEAEASLVAWLATGEVGGVLCMPTGSGKTQTATSFLVRHALAEGTTVLWLTHREELVDQAIRTLLRTAHREGRGLRVGRYQGGARKAREPVDVLVASLPTLTRAGALEAMQRDQDLIRLVVVDECHHAAARTWKELLRALSKRKGARLLGLSATPTRTVESERATLARLFDGRMIYEAHAADLIRRDVLARPEFRFVATHADVKATEKEHVDWLRFHDLPASLVKRIAANPRRNDLIARHAVEAASTGPTLVFASEMDSARAIVTLIREKGGSVELVTHQDPPPARKAALRAFERGEVCILVNLTIFSEGTDLPGVQNVLIGRPTTSPVLFAQMVGRGLRGKEMGGTSRCSVVVFHEEVLNLAGQALTTSFTETSGALAALGCDELAEPAPVVAAATGLAVADISRMPTREVAGLRAKMEALLARLSGEAVTSSRWGGVPVPLAGWWVLEEPTRRLYLPVFGPDLVVLEQLMQALAAHVAGSAHRPEPSRAVCLPEGLLERFVERASTERLVPRYVGLDGVGSEQKTLFAQAVLDVTGSGELVELPCSPIDLAPPLATDGSVTVPPPTDKMTTLALREYATVTTAVMPAHGNPGALEDAAGVAPAPLVGPTGTKIPAPEATVPAARARQNTVLSAHRAPASDLHSVRLAATNVPREHRREWLADVHRRRFAGRYPDLVEFVIAVMSADAEDGADAPPMT